MKSITLEEVARLAGVSPSTVSRVINGQVGPRSRAREQVLRVIKETGFQPHAAARSLASRRSHVLGLLFAAPAHTVLSHPNLLQLAEVLTQACHDADHVLSLFLATSGIREHELLSKLTRPGLVDGLIVRGVGGEQSAALFVRLEEIGIPFVAVGRPHNPQGISYVATDNVMAAYHAASHLLRLGHTRLGLIVGPAHATYTQERITGYTKAHQERGAPIDERLTINEEMDLDHFDIQALLQNQPTALLLETRMAGNVMRALQRLDLRVPEDIAIVGFDDLPQAQHTLPKLTTMRQPMHDIAKQIISILLDLIENGMQPPRQVVFEQELVIRQSCGAVSR